MITRFTLLRWIGLLIILAVSFFMFLFLVHKEQAMLMQAPQVQIRIAVSQTPLSSPFLVAKQLDIFAKYGLDVTLVPCYGGIDCIRGLFAGTADYATASESVVMFESFKRKDFMVLSSFVQSDNDLKLLSLQRTGIRQMSDLIGKTVGVVEASASEFYLDALLLVHNLTHDQIKRVYLKPQALTTALFDGQVDAISVWEPYGYQAASQSETPLIDLSLSGVYQLSFNLLMMRSFYIQKQETHQRLLQALADTIDWIHQHPESSRSIVGKALSIKKIQLETTWKDYVFQLSLGNALLSNLQLQARWAIDTGIVNGALPDYRKMLASDALERLRDQQGGVLP
ncbi:ABC transporter substrate-binding protein [Vibrio rhizosphaerae]|uniref:ABC transporter substrate-binding protein n=1 Tax=Vibrio rhizosphaerae TaxID=398736 RepID=A0ABU4IY88_9VIBR|nr:ABC transporter substrate-binding protein [Vibrio rhizosphaerae]MDW6094123.1 ABC transporter substrate-binding protein [Vibrio rhizosphaerae]